MRAELVLEANAVLGEGPIWHPQENRLYWVDIDPGILHIFDPLKTVDHPRSLGRMTGCICFRSNGGLLAAGAEGIFEVDLAGGRSTLVVNPLTDDPQLRFNDGKVDPRGRFWAGTYHMQRQPHRAALFCLEPDWTLRLVLDGLTNSNGLGWSPDGTVFYHIDTPTLEVSAYDFEKETGRISNRRCVVRFAEGMGRPDGMAVDVQGRLWIAHFDGGCVSCWDPRTGKREDVIDLPCARVTSCTFGGPDLDQLFITTASKGLSVEQRRKQPWAGSLFCARPGVRGLPPSFFLG